MHRVRSGILEIKKIYWISRSTKLRLEYCVNGTSTYRAGLSLDEVSCNMIIQLYLSEWMYFKIYTFM